MNKPEFVYTTYIKTTPQKVWEAITNPEFTRQYWKCELRSDWKQGSQWTSELEDGNTGPVGEVIESNPPKRLVLKWWKTDNPADKSRAAFDIEAIEDMTRLTVTHDQLSDDVAGRIAIGWPRVLSSMKTFLETGSALDTWAGHPICTTEKKAVKA